MKEARTFSAHPANQCTTLTRPSAPIANYRCPQDQNSKTGRSQVELSVNEMRYQVEVREEKGWPPLI